MNHVSSTPPVFSTANKILPLDKLAQVAEKLKAKKKRLVLCHGVFDLIHNGHIRHLQRAREHGDVLAVTVTADAYVHKGPGRPVFSEDLRAEAVAALSCVDYVAINRAATAINVIELLKPAVYAKGSDYKISRDDLTGNIVYEKQRVHAHGGRVVFTDEITFSSSSLLNEYFGVFTEQTKAYLRDLRKKYSSIQIIEKIRALKDLKVLVVGDAIVDEYHYTAPLGASGKGNVLSVKYELSEQFAGGALAVANHIACYAKEVTLVTGLGTRSSHEAFIRSKLAKNVKPVFFSVENAPTIVKRRYVDPDMAKLFEVYYFKDEPLPEAIDRKVCSWLRSKAGKFDAVVVPDFGNGFISPAMVKILCLHASFLAVNTQVNSGNRGYHVITRYVKADFVSLNEPELRLASHNRHDPLRDLAMAMGRKLHCSSLAVTRGTQGAVLLDVRKGVSHKVPVLSTRVIDRVGAGDSFLSLASICLASGMEKELAVFVGSAAAALDVQIVCNREPVASQDLYKYITTLMK